MSGRGIHFLENWVNKNVTAAISEANLLILMSGKWIIG
jgi:hypothetical protein